MRDARQEFVDDYRVMGVSPDASHREIREAYRREAMRWHPDRNASADAAGRMRLVNEAWGVLGEPEGRSKFDEMRLKSGAGDAPEISNEEKGRGPRRRPPKRGPGMAQPAGDAPRWGPLRLTADRLAGAVLKLGMQRAAVAMMILLVLTAAGLVAYLILREDCEGTNALHRLLYRTHEGVFTRNVDRIEVEAWEVEALKVAGIDLRDRDDSCQTALTIAAGNALSAAVLSSLIGPGVVERSPSALPLLISNPDVGFSQIEVLTDRGAVQQGRKYAGTNDSKSVAAYGHRLSWIEFVIDERYKYPIDQYPSALAHIWMSGVPTAHLELLVAARKHAGTNSLEDAVIMRRSTPVLSLLAEAGGIETGGLALNYIMYRDFVDPVQVQLLIEAGARIDARDYSGRTPLEIALAMRHPRAVVDLVTP